MEHYNLDEIDGRAVVPGVSARFVHSENMTFAYWDLEQGAEVPQHGHPHEQVVNMLEGELELTVGDETRRLKAGDVVVIPSNATHSVTCITPCRVLDVFNPVREDFKQK